MFPDKAVLYLCAIEDEEYKQDKIECASVILLCIKLCEKMPYFIVYDLIRLEQRLWVQHACYQANRIGRAAC